MRSEAIVTGVADPLPAGELGPALVPDTPVSPALRVASFRAALARTNQAASFVVIAVLCLLWAMFLRPQSLGGPAGYVLVSGKSMLPLYHTGDLILVQRKASYRTGDIIAYRVPKGDPMAGAQVIHRIIGGDAKRGFVVQGDNRTAPDIWRPMPNDIVGVSWLQIPHAVVLLQFLRSPLLLGLLAASFVFVHLLSSGKAEDVDENTAAA
jgi:signal peptidase